MNEPVSPKVTIPEHNPPDVSGYIGSINDFLRCPWSDCERRGGRYFGIGTMTNPERKAIMAAYKSKGWKVMYHSDQRDGDALVFMPPVYRGGER